MSAADMRALDQYGTSVRLRPVTPDSLRAEAHIILRGRYEFYHDEMAALLLSAACALEAADESAPYSFWLGADV